MTHDIFISYSSKNMSTALEICRVLESNGVKCWIAPRNIPAGADYGDIIDEAIHVCKAFLLLYSEQSSKSPWVKGELNLAFTEDKHIVPFRIDNTPLTGAMKLILNQRHWIDADPDDKFKLLLESITAIVGVKINIAQPEKVVESSELDMPYQIGLSALCSFDLTTAFLNLGECAIEGYKNSRDLFCNVISNRSRVFMLDDDIFDQMQEAAERGNSYAQFVIGTILRLKWNKNETSFDYLSRSAKQNDPFGIYALGRSYMLGVGTDININRYKQLINKAVYMNNSAALLYLGRDYTNGWNHAPNPQKGIELITRAMEMGLSESYSILGNIYWSGIHLEQNTTKAEQLYKQAIALGHYEAYEDLAYIYMYKPNTYEANDTAKGIEIMLEGGNLGVPCCLTSLALAYLHGNGVRKDIKNAIRWATRASDRGDLFALYLLGHLYYYGEEGIEIDCDKAWGYLSRAAKGLDANSSMLMGRMCLDGNGGDGESLEDGIKHLERAGSLGSTEALVTLYNIFRTEKLDPKSIYFKGTSNGTLYSKLEDPKFDMLSYEGIEKDDDKALSYLERAANTNDAASAYIYGLILTDTESIFSDEFKGKTMLDRALARGDKRAAARLGYLYYEGVAIPEDRAKAKECYKIALDADFKDAIVPYYSCLFDELGDDDYDKENPEIIKWVTKGAELKIPQALLDLGVINYAEVFGLKRDMNYIIELYSEAAELGSKSAAVNLGNIYFEGDGVEKQPLKSIDWYLKAHQLGYRDEEAAKRANSQLKGIMVLAECGNTEAMLKIAHCFNVGLGTTPNRNKAILWYRKAALAGDTEAKESLLKLGVE